MDHKLTRQHSPTPKPAKAARRSSRSEQARNVEPLNACDNRAFGGRGFSPAERELKKARALAPEASSGTVSVSTEPPITFVQQMRDFLRRNATWFLIAGFVFLVLQDVFGAHGLIAMRRSQMEADAVQKEIQQLSDENQHLLNQAQSLKTDRSAIERAAREMGLSGPHELIFRLPPKPGESSTLIAKPEEPSSPQPPRPKKR
jgi:cell division protein FtsB